MKQRLARFMSGRYGMDAFGKFLNIFVLVLLMISLFAPVMTIPALVFLVYQYIRIFSRRTYKRSEENAAYMRVSGKIKGRFALIKKHMRERKTHHFYKCPACKQRLRVPKGKGKVCVTCPKCKERFEKVA